MPSKSPAKKANVSPAALVHAQTLIPRNAREEIEAFAKEIDPVCPNFTAALRRIVLEWVSARRSRTA